MHEWLTKDLSWKAFSVLLAVVIWLTVHNNLNESPAAPHRDNTYSDLPVTPVFLLPGGSAKIDPAAVTITVSGPREVMSVLQENEICPQVNLSGVESGHDLRRSVEVAVPPGITVVGVDPPEVTVTVSPPASKPQGKTNE